MRRGPITRFLFLLAEATWRRRWWGIVGLVEYQGTPAALQGYLSFLNLQMSRIWLQHEIRPARCTQSATRVCRVCFTCGKLQYKIRLPTQQGPYDGNRRPATQLLRYKICLASRHALVPVFYAFLCDCFWLIVRCSQLLGLSLFSMTMRSLLERRCAFV